MNLHKYKVPPKLLGSFYLPAAFHSSHDKVSLETRGEGSFILYTYERTV